MHIAGIALAGALIAGGATATGVVLLTSGPFSNNQATIGQELTATAEPGTSPTETPESRLATLVERGAATSDWALISDPRLPVGLRVRPEFVFSVRELPPLVMDDPGVVRIEMTITDRHYEGEAPLPPHSWPEQLVTLSLLWLPTPLEPIPFGEIDAQTRDRAAISVLNHDLELRDLEGPDGPRRVIVESSLPIAGGTLHLFGMAFPSSDELLVLDLIGLLQSLEFTS